MEILWISHEKDRSVQSSASKRSKNSPYEPSTSLGVAAFPSSLLFHHSRVYSTHITWPESNRLCVGGTPRSAAIHDDYKRLTKLRSVGMAKGFEGWTSPVRICILDTFISYTIIKLYDSLLKDWRRLILDDLVITNSTRRQCQPPPWRKVHGKIQ